MGTKRLQLQFGLYGCVFTRLLCITGPAVIAGTAIKTLRHGSPFLEH